MTMSLHTDNAAPCWHCQCTVASYTVDDHVSLVDIHCHGCHRRDVFYRRADGSPVTAAQISKAHRRFRHD